MNGFRFIIILILFCNLTANADFDNSIIENTKRAVVSIKTISNYSSYEKTGSYSGTGFIINKEKGLITTNRHVVHPASASNYEVTFYDGTTIEAKLKYANQWADVAFLQVDPNLIPENIIALKINDQPLEINQNILIIGNNNRDEFSIQTGTVTSLYQSDYLDTQDFRISLNIKGGASGSPTVNDKGELVGIIFAATQTAASAINAGYIKEFYERIIADKPVNFNNPGFLAEYQSLNDAIKYVKFPTAEINEFAAKYPDAMYKALRIKYVFFDSDSAKFLLPGDIIWKLNGKDVGPNLYEMQKTLNGLAKYDLEVYRNGKLLTFKNISNYNTSNNSIKRFVYFGGAAFYEADDFVRYHIGTKNRALTISNISSSGSFNTAFPPNYVAYYLNEMGDFIEPTAFNDATVTNLDDLIKIIPSLIKQKHFQMTYKFHGTTLTNLNIIYTNDHPLTSYVKYNELDEKPRLFWFNDQNLTWESKVIE
jgi:S1-C subfamily serine protease